MAASRSAAGVIRNSPSRATWWASRATSPDASYPSACTTSGQASRNAVDRTAECTSTRERNAARPPVARSTSAAVNGRCSGHPVSSHPNPSSTAAVLLWLCAATASSASASDDAVLRSTPVAAKPVWARCACASTNAGVTSRPARSTTRVAPSSKCTEASSSPVHTTVPSSTHSAVACGSAGVWT